MNRSETIGKFAAAFVKAQAAMGNAVKGSANPFFKSKFADLNSIREAATPALNEQGIAILQPTTVIDGVLYIETTLMHESGEYVSGLYQIVVAKPNDPQALGSSVSYARRYGLQAMVSLGAEDDDAEGSLGRKSSYSAPKIEAKSTPASTEKTTPVASQGSETPPKKGFGVKPKVEVKTESSDGWE